MKKDYHIHAQILRENIDSEAFIQTAIAHGFDEICITDHMPLSISNAGDRIPHGRVGEYCRKVREFADKYKGQISIKCGIEVDYHPTLVGEIEDVLSQGDFDYVLGSSHMHLFIDGITSHKDYVNASFENTMRAAKSGYFDIIPHINMYKWVFANPQRFHFVNHDFCEAEHEEIMEETLTAIREHGLLLEINSHFAETTGNIQDIYPSEFITRKALDMGVRFSFGSDAHHAKHIGALLDDLREHPIYSKAIEGWETM